MFVSPRFRDIFGSGPIRTRRTDSPAGEDTRGSSDAERAADAIWRDITAAHRRAASVFTPEFNRVEDVAQDEG